jgi:signal transduction histidine kinase
MGQIEPEASKARARTWTGGLLVTLGAVALLELLSRTLLTIRDPGPVLLLAVLYAAFGGGMAAGFASAALATLYALYSLATPGRPFHSIGENASGLLVLLLSAPAIVLLVGLLKRRGDRALELSSRANASLRAEVAEGRRAEEAAKALAQIGRELVGTLDPNQVAERITSTVVGLFGARNSDLFQLESDSGSLVCLASAGPAATGKWAGRSLGPGEAIVSLAVAEGRPAWTADILADPRIRPPAWLRDRAREDGVGAVVGVPLIVRGVVIGAFGLGDAAGRVFTEAELELLSAFASQAAIALENARLYDEARRALDELKATQDQLVRVETLRAVGELASGMAHHLNNLLAVIVGRSQLLLLKVNDPEIRRSLEIVERTALAGGEVLRRVQGFTRMQSVSQAAPVDLNQLAREVLELTRPLWRDQAQVRGVSIEPSLELEPIPPVTGDPTALSEALMNLFLNAVDALPAGGRVTINTWAVDRGVFCSVSDNGVGMTEEVRRRALEPFFTTKGPRSTGLGLSATYGILRRHGGELTLETAVGLGTTVTIRLPAAPLPRPTEPPAPGPAARPIPQRILVIDDELDVRETLAGMLAGQGHTVVQASSGHEGLARLEAGEAVDLVLTDLGMPELPGWQVAKAIKARWPGLRVGLVTGWGQAPDGAEEERRAVDFVLAKPITLDALREATKPASA